MTAPHDISLQRIADALERIAGALDRMGMGVSGGGDPMSLEGDYLAEIGQLRAALWRVLPLTVNEGTRIVNDALGLNRGETTKE